VKLYGLAHCSTVKRARAWLAQHAIEVPFHDLRRQGITRDMARAWIEQVGWETLINRSGTTWRKLPDPDKRRIMSAATAERLMLEQPSVIKRPVLELRGRVIVGFEESRYRSLFLGAPR